MGDSIPFSTSFEGCLVKYYPGEAVRYGFTPYFYLQGGCVEERDRYGTDALPDYFELDEEAQEQ
jgi:hypothetical protein